MIDKFYMQVLGRILNRALWAGVLIFVILIGGFFANLHVIVFLCVHPRWPIIASIIIGLFYLYFALNWKNIKHASLAGYALGSLIAFVMAIPA